jgi:hypothetical protein
LNVISSRRGNPFCSPSTIDVGGDALAEHIFAIETILNITATSSAEIFTALFCLVGAGASLSSGHTLRP